MTMRTRPHHLVAFTAGAVLALAADRVARTDPGGWERATQANLGAIAAVEVGFGLVDGRTLPVVAETAAGAATLVAAARLPARHRPLLLVAHAAWDALHHPRGITTRMPWWYPAMCAGFDLAYAAAVRRPPA